MWKDNKFKIEVSGLKLEPRAKMRDLRPDSSI